MNCPSCRTPIPIADTACPDCGDVPEWYIRKPDGQVYGPLRNDAVERCRDEARIGAGDEARVGTDGDFLPIHDVLGRSFVAPPPPAAQPYAAPVSAPTPPKPIDRRRRLAVVAIVSFVVLALTIVVVSIAIGRHIERERSATCERNLRAIAQATLSYAIDHDDKLPAIADSWDPAMHQLMATYLTGGTESCPEDRYGLGYAANAALFGLDHTTIAHPGQVLFWWDASASPPGTVHHSPVGYTIGTKPRHAGKDNFVFLDGHVTPFEPGRIVGITRPPKAP